MKKFYTVFILLFSIVLVTGCSEEKSTPPEPEAPNYVGTWIRNFRLDVFNGTDSTVYVTPSTIELYEDSTGYRKNYNIPDSYTDEFTWRIIGNGLVLDYGDSTNHWYFLSTGENYIYMNIEHTSTRLQYDEFYRWTIGEAPNLSGVWAPIRFIAYGFSCSGIVEIIYSGFQDYRISGFNLSSQTPFFRTQVDSLCTYGSIVLLKDSANQYGYIYSFIRNGNYLTLTSPSNLNGRLPDYSRYDEEFVSHTGTLNQNLIGNWERVSVTTTGAPTSNPFDFSSIHFTPDSMMYVSNGDSLHWSVTDNWLIYWYDNSDYHNDFRWVARYEMTTGGLLVHSISDGQYLENGFESFFTMTAGK